jgi:predicted GNAT family acetyltransferase
MTVTDHPEQLRYEIEVDGEVAGFLLYHREPGVLELVHTDVDPKWEGKGVGAALVQGTLDDVRARGLKVRPFCPFVRAYLRRHPEYEDLIVD